VETSAGYGTTTNTTSRNSNILSDKNLQIWTERGVARVRQLLQNDGHRAAGGGHGRAGVW
ncbi:unnamed protein product, partial [Amoebophrya sp. A120]